MTLRPHQVEFLDAIRAEYRAGASRILGVASCGFGKTVALATMANGALEKGLRTIITVHRQELMDQTGDTLTAMGVPFAEIKAGEPVDNSKLVQVAMVNTLIRRFAQVESPAFVVVDEASHSVAETWKRIFTQYPNARYCGMTASPERRDSKGLGELYQRMVLGKPVSWMIENGFLKRPIHYGPQNPVNLENVPKVAGDYNQKLLADVMDRPTLVGDAVETWKKLGRGLQSIAFCCNLKHSESVCAAFNAAGIPAECIDGEMSPDDRRARKTRLGNGTTRILCSVDVVSEGVDVPAVSCALLLRPTFSLSLFIQQTGRAMRPVEGQKEAIILDFSNNCEKHGLACWDRNWSLEGGAGKRQPKEQVIETRQCTSCYQVFQGLVCPGCGLVRESKVREIRRKEGELAEIQAEELAAKRKLKVEEWSARSYADFAKIAAERGYAKGWAFFRWKNSRYNRPKKPEPQMNLV